MHTAIERFTVGVFFDSREHSAGGYKTMKQDSLLPDGGLNNLVQAVFKDTFRAEFAQPGDEIANQMAA